MIGSRLIPTVPNIHRRLITTLTLAVIVDKTLVRGDPMLAYRHYDTYSAMLCELSHTTSSDFGLVPARNVQPMFNTIYVQTTGFFNLCKC